MSCLRLINIKRSKSVFSYFSFVLTYNFRCKFNLNKVIKPNLFYHVFFFKFIFQLSYVFMTYEYIKDITVYKSSFRLKIKI